jgi:putative FmdB family regulatory protein
VPTYEYACTACGERLEVVQRITDEPLTDCPRCAGRLRKVFAPVGVVFKGSGFYATDSRRKPAADKPATDKPAADKPTKDTGDAAKSATATKSEKTADKPATMDKGSAGKVA